MIVQKIMYLLFFILLILIGCSSKISEEDLIGGNWMAIAGYKDGKPEGEPYCKDFLIGGLEFKNKEVVHGYKFDEEYKYQLEERKKGTAIEIIRKDRYYSYYIDKINEDEIGLVGANGFQEDESCYFERQ